MAHRSHLSSFLLSLCLSTSVLATSISNSSQTFQQPFHHFGRRDNLPAIIDLASLTATQGSIIKGAAANDQAGFSVSSAGDVNGDGIDDLIIGAIAADPNGISNAGAIYLIYGSSSLPATIDLSTFTAAQGSIIQGAVAGDQAGFSVSTAGDVNDDGIDDLIIGAPFASPNGRNFAGASYIIYGSSSLPATIDLSTLTAAQGSIIQGAAANDASGRSVSSAGDVNGDGTGDLIIGAPFASPNGRGGAGAIYLIYGSSSLPATIDLSTLTAAQGSIIQGAVAGDQAGGSVSTAGDVNGDGRKDLIIGANLAAPNGSDPKLVKKNRYKTEMGFNIYYGYK